MSKSKVNKKVFSIPKSILITGQTLAFVSPRLATDFALKLFRTPYKFPMPKREIKMFDKAQKSRLFIKTLQKDIQLYTCGTGEKKIMLIHGWAGRGTQLNAITEIFVEKGYQTISFDATAHGQSQGKTSNMTEFIACIHAIDEKYGPFDFAVGHSLGGMALMNAVKNGFQVSKIATVGCGNSINDICQQFVKKLGMKPIIGYKLKNKMDKIFGSDIELLSTYIAAKSVNIPVLVMHDLDDEDVPVSNAYYICNNLSNHELFISEGLGHRNILWDKKALRKMIEFFKI